MVKTDFIARRADGWYNNTVMKKTQLIDLLSTIRKTAVSFVVIIVFIALGLAFYGGAAWGTAHTEGSLNRTYRDGSVRTLLVTDPFGLTESQISELEAIDGIDDAEGLNIVYRFLKNKNGTAQQAAIVQITERIDRLLNIEGRLPNAAGEAAVLRSWAEENGIGIGDVIELQDENASDYRKLHSVRSVAQWNGSDLNDLIVSADDPGYLADNNLTVTALVDSPVYLSTNPYAHGICSANGLYIDAVLFVSGQEMPAEAFGGYTSVALYSDELNGISSFSDEYKSRSEALSEDVQNVIDAWDKQLIEDFSASVDKIRAQLDKFTEQTGMLSPDGEIMYEQLDVMRDELRTQEHISGVMETDSNNSFLTAENLLGVLKSMRSVLGITFLTIGILISYSVVSRLVADAAVQIGTREALGFYRHEIIRFYLCYVGAALLLGGITGMLTGIFGIEFAFVKVFAAQFTFSPMPLLWDISDILPAFIIVSGIILAVTVSACYVETGKRAIILLQGTQEDAESYDFINKSRVFSKLSLLNRTVLLNLFRDRRRVFGMITGIAGAAALIAAGLTFYLNFATAFSKQFEDYYRFDYQVSFDASSDTASGEIRRVLDRYRLDYAEIYSSCFIMHTPDGKTNAPNVIVPADKEELAKIMYFDTKTSESVSYDSGLWMSDYYHYAFDKETGSLLDLQTLNGTKAEIPVDCYFRNHLSTPVIVMDSDTYLNAFGEDASPNTFYVSAGGLSIETLSAELEGIDGYIYTTDFYESCLTSFLSEKMVVSAFAILFIIMAVIMALMTIINLMNVYISEKKNELIILMINGYDHSFAKKYIYQDTVVLTAIGIIIGLIAGSILGDCTLTALDGTSIRLIHGVSWLSCAVSAAATAGLTALICLRALRRIDSFKLSDISSSL